MFHLYLDIFNSIYCDFKVSISCSNNLTDSIAVEKGVLQGDPCSPLLFNICFNSLVRVLDSPEYRNMGYIWGNKNSQTCNWLQYADDAALIAKDQKCAQGLANTFDAWCSWARMDIRTDKCCCFGMAKKDSRQVQILPNISVKLGKIPAVAIGEHFKYLGRYFDFKMDDCVAKSKLDSDQGIIVT